MIRIAIAAALLVAVPAGQTTRDGVYTETQAKRGEEIYAKSCASCHASDLSGSGQAPALADADFAKEWDAQPLSDLFERIRTTMPQDKPGTLTQQQASDVTAYILKANKFPGGRAELAADTAVQKQVSWPAAAATSGSGRQPSVIPS